MGWTNDGKSIVFRSQRDSYTLPISEALHRFRLRRRARRAADARSRFRAIFRRRHEDDLFAAHQRFSFGKTLRRRAANTLYIYDLQTNDAKKSRKACAPRATRCGSATEFFTIQTRDGNLIFTFSMCRRANHAGDNFKDWEVRWASSDDQSRIVYERNGELEIFDTEK
jgi:hypothetical protein